MIEGLAILEFYLRECNGEGSRSFDAKGNDEFAEEEDSEKELINPFEFGFSDRIFAWRIFGNVASRNVYAWYIVGDGVRVDGVIWLFDFVGRDNSKAGIIGGN